jgi:predicted O-linked N-acetylglucosamine transferase (SPINDLY family)
MAEIDKLLDVAAEAQTAGRLREARGLLEEIVARDPGHGPALHRLGLVTYQEGDGAGAVALLRRAGVARIPDVQAFGNLGAVLLRHRDFDAAEAALTRAVETAPDNPENHYNLGLARRGLGRRDSAEASYRRAIELDPGHAAAHNNLGNLLAELGRDREAEMSFRAAIEADPEFAPAYRNLADFLEADGDAEGACKAFGAAIRVRPDDGARIRMATVLPVIAQSARHLAESRAAFEARLDALAAAKLDVADPLRQVGGTVFLASYHGVSDRAAHEKLAAVHARACPGLAFTAPHCENWKGPQGDKIRIGIVSGFLREHTVARLNEGLIKRLPRDRFDVALFACSRIADGFTAELEAAADSFMVLPPDLAAARDAIAAARLDILHFTDIGMEPVSYFLGFARLAPVQCVSWGHPDTTGIPNVDYFLSSALTEPDGAETEYSEELVRLPCFTTAVKRPAAAPGLSRADLGAARDAKLFVCPQSLFKFHPDFDELIRRILDDDKRSELILVHGNRRAWSMALRERWRRTLPNEIDQIRFLPRLTGAQFIGLLAAADVVLDTPHFCGGMTTYQAIAVGAPVVTLPGEFMRGRLSLGLMREMEVEDTVAASADAYVETALALANDKVLAQSVRSRIADNADRLFDSTLAIAEHARFFESAVQRAIG